MLYFTIREPLLNLTREQRGDLFMAILDYAEEGKAPSFEEPIMRLAWGFVVPLLDADDKRYQDTRLKRRYAAYCREAKRKGDEILIFDDWLNHHMISCDDFDDQNHPISVSISNPISVSVSESVSESISISEKEKKTESKSETDDYMAFCLLLGIPDQKIKRYQRYATGPNWKEIVTRMWNEDKGKFKQQTASAEFVYGREELEAIQRLKNERQIITE